MKNKELKRLFTGLIAAGLCFAAPNGTLGISAFAEETGGDTQETTTGSSDSSDAPTDPVDETETQESEASQTDEKPEENDDSQTDAQANEIEHSNDEAADTDSNENTVPVVTAAQAPVPAAASEPDRPFWINNDTLNSYTTLSEAVNAAEDGSIVHMRGELGAEAVSGANVNKNITLDVASDTTITGDGNSNGFTLASGSKIQTAENATFTMEGFGTALTVETGAIMTDGTYDFTNVNTGINLKGAMSGSDQSKMHVTVTANKNAVGIDTTGSDVKYSNVTLIWNGGRKDDWTYRNMDAENSHIEISDVWLYNSADNPLRLNNSYFKISGRFNPDSWRGGHVLAVYEDGAEFDNSTVIVDGSRINVIHKNGLTINNSTVTVQNSPDGGFNVNYGSTLAVHSSILKADNVKKGFIAAGYNDASNLYIDGSSVIETAGSSSADSIGVDGSFVVTGGSYKVDESQLARDELIPTNGESNGNEKLTLFHLADPSVSSISMINANGAAYLYSVTQANEDGEKRVWSPKASVVFRLNNGNATFADGTTADKNGTTIRGNSLNFVKGNTDPGTPVSKDKFLGWFYKDSQGTEHPFSMDMAVSGNIDVYAKWENISVIYHNLGGQSYVQTAQPGQNEMTVLGYPDIVSRKSDFAVQGKTFEYWTTAEDGTGRQYQKDDQILFDNGETQVDLYAYYGVKHYSVRFSANGGVFSQDSVFHNPDYFTIETDNYGGETAVLKQTATYGQTLHDLTGALGLDYNLLKPDANATQDGYRLDDTQYWSTSAFSGEGSTVRFDDYKLWIWTISGENPTITEDTTWYLKWTPRAEQSKFNGTLDLDADIWHDGADNGSDSTRIASVKPGDTVTLTGAVDVKKVKEKMVAIADSFDVGKDDYSNISISSPKCSFTAAFKIPAGFAVPDENGVKIAAEGLGDCFDVTDTKISGRTITVTFSLKGGITNFQQLYDAVNSTGIETELTPKLKNTITLTVSGLKVNGENKSDRDILTIDGNVTGNFRAIATMNAKPAPKKVTLMRASAANAAGQEKSYYFEFTFNGSQKEHGKDSNKDSKGLSISYRLSKPLNLVLLGDITSEGAADSRAIRQAVPGSSLYYIGRLDVSSIKDQIDTMAGSESEHAIKDVTSTFKAEIKLGKGLTSNATKENVTLTDNNLFAISDVTVKGNVVTVTMSLKRTDYSSFQELKKEVAAVGDILEVKVPVIAPQNAKSMERITSTGKLSGTFSAKVVDANGIVLYEPTFNWDAKQAGKRTTSALGNGKDAAQSTADNDTISYTVQMPQVFHLPADVSALVGTKEITEHDAVYPVSVGDPIELVGALDVSSIQKQLNDIAKEHGDPDGITLTNAEGKPGVDFDFTLKLKFPSGMSVAPDAVAEAVGDTFGKDAFMIKSTNVDGQELTVRFGLDNPSVHTFDELARIVRSAGPVMKIRLSGLKITGAGKQTVAVESLEGYFFATAKNENDSTMTFNFSWSALQSTKGEGGLFTDNLGDGKDFAQDADDNATIGFTLIASEKSSPVQPSKSDQPSAASSTVFPKTYALPHKFIPRTGAEN